MWENTIMSKKNIAQRNVSKYGKKYSHGGNKPLVPHINDPKVMVTQKVRTAQEGKRNDWLHKRKLRITSA